MCVVVGGVDLFFIFFHTVPPRWLGLWLSSPLFSSDSSLIATRVKELVFLSTYAIALLAKVQSTFGKSYKMQKEYACVI